MRRWMKTGLAPAMAVLALALLGGIHSLAMSGAADELTADDLVRDDGRTRGSAQAPVTLIEYSDFTCGFCQKFFLETLPRLQTKYIETGKVRFLYRDFPRAQQGPGLQTALATRCAGAQGRYWAMHDQLFARPGEFDGASIRRHARTIGLDVPVFTKCLQDGRDAKAIFQDKAEGQSLGFRGTPGFVLLETRGPNRTTPIALPGAFPFSVFEEQIDRLLANIPKH